VSTFLNPIGPEPPMVYWIRRGAIVLVVITLIVGLWWLIGSLRGGSSTSSSAPSTSASAEPSASGDTGDTGGSASPQASSSGAAAATTDCLDADIKVEATTDSSTYPVGSTPKLTLTITNTGDVACTRDVGPKANELEITSGGYHVWSSDDCNASSKSKVAELQPGDKVASSITWNGKLSQKGCPNGQGAAAKAGRYDLVGRNETVTSKSTPFALTNG
jgi:hypothetical protein